MGTLAKVTGKTKEIFGHNIWPGIVSHFPDDQYYFRMTMAQCIDQGHYRSGYFH